MDLKKVNYNNEKYFLNPDQYFIFNSPLVKEKLDEIKFPVIMMDTEFFNKSHNLDNIKPVLYDEESPDLIYTLSFSIAKNYQEIINRNNKKTMQLLSIRRKYKEPNFDFRQELDKVLTKFFNYAIKHKVKTFIFAGKANDEKILNLWINKHSQVFHKKQMPFLIKNNLQEWKIKIVDIYPILEQGLSFHYDPKEEHNLHYKKGLSGEDTYQLPSLKAFYDAINFFPEIKELKEEDNIYVLCIDVLKLYSLKTIKANDFKKYQTSYRQAVKHCQNDVLKLVYLIYFLYLFANKSPKLNPFVTVDGY